MEGENLYATDESRRQVHFWKVIRPLAKLGKAVKIADSCNQRKAKSETVPAISAAFREDTKPFDKADSVFNKDTFLWNLTVIFAFLFGQRMLLGTLFRQKRIGIYQSKTSWILCLNILISFRISFPYFITFLYFRKKSTVYSGVRHSDACICQHCRANRRGF